MKAYLSSIYVASIIAFLTSPCYAQNWTWAKSATCPVGGYAEGWNVTTDASGNVYITGNFSQPSITFGAYTLTCTGGQTIFLVKYDSAGNVIWARKPTGTTGSDGGTSIVTDRSGNVYLSGLFRSPTITFGATTLVNAGSADFFLAKYDSSGNVIWARRAGGTGFDETGDFTGNTVAVDASANVFVTGYFDSPSITFGAFTVNNTGGSADMFIAKYDSSGNALWANASGGNNFDAATSVATDASGNVYAMGYFGSSSITFGSYTLTNLSSGYSDMFLVKYDANGNVIRATSTGAGVMTINVPFNFCVATDAAQNVFITGGYQSPTITFGAYILTNNSTNGCNVFVAKYDSSGTVLWAKSAGGNNYDCGYSISVDPLGYAYVTGVFSLIGNTSITFDSYTLNYPAGGSDPMFIVKYDANGNALCASALASGGDDNNGVAADAFGNAYITGDFLPNNFAVGSTTLTLTSGSEDAFVAKYICDSVSNMTSSCDFIPSTSLSIDTLSYTFSGGIFASYGCAPIDPTYWMSGSGMYALITFVNPEDYPSIRVWGMNDDDSVSVQVNGVNYPMNLSSAFYNPKVVCGLSPGPDGVIFVNGNIVGANSNAQGNYSYQDVTINSTNVFTIKVTGISGAGWGFAGASVDCGALPTALFSSPNSICPGSCLSFTNLSSNATQYQWYFTGGNPSNDTSANPSNICYFNSGSYDVTLVAINASGSDTLLLSNYITVFPQPTTPTISQSGDTLFATQGYAGYQWYFGSDTIAGATNYFYVATQSGNYNIVVTDENGCTVGAGIVNVIAGELGVERSEPGVSLFPNPTSGEFVVSSSLPVEKLWLRITNILGKTVFTTIINHERETINTKLNSGIYFVELISDKYYSVKKLFVN